MTSRNVQPPEQMIETDTPLWRFSVALWKDTRTAKAALELQAAGWVVSHLLVAAFLTRDGCLWDGREPVEIHQWRRDVTQPLRTLRAALPKGRSDLSALRAQVAQAELEAERVELGWWYQWLERHPLPKTPAQPPLRLLAENMVAAGGQVSAGDFSLLENFAQALIATDARGPFSLELQAVLDQADPQP